MHTKFVSQKNKNGFALLLAIIISSVVLAIGVSLLHLSVSQINLSSNARESEIAFQAAHAGMDCLWYWRYSSTTVFAFTEADAGSAAPPLTCFQKNGMSTSHTQPAVTSGVGVVDVFEYTFDWKSMDRCSVVSMYILQPESPSDMTLDLTAINEGIGTNGIKTCDADGTCTVIVSKGYNRKCSDVGSSIFTIQRELTVEF